MSSITPYTASLHSSDFALTSIYSSVESNRTWNPNTEWPVNDEGQRLSKEQVVERLQELFELEHLMKEFAELDETGVYERKAAS